MTLEKTNTMKASFSHHESIKVQSWAEESLSLNLPHGFLWFPACFFEKLEGSHIPRSPYLQCFNQDGAHKQVLSGVISV